MSKATTFLFKTSVEYTIIEATDTRIAKHLYTAMDAEFHDVTDVDLDTLERNKFKTRETWHSNGRL